MEVERMKKNVRKIAELKRPANIYLEDLEIEIIPFLTWEVIKYIGDVLIQLDDTYDVREVSKHALILKFCTDLTDEEISELDFETIWANGYIDEIESHIRNIDKIDEYIEHETNPNKEMCKLLKELEKLIESGKKVNWKKVLKQAEKASKMNLSDELLKKE
nr:MAG TPA: hypothetical protein [Caudoviricetes sp.]